MKKITTKDFEIDCTGNTLVTLELQKLLDMANEDELELTISKGDYLVSNLFVKSNTKIIFEDGAKLIATTDENEYLVLDTRVAGIEMPWYVAVINVIDAKNVTICGNGIIDGSGKYWWEKYWGADGVSGMRAIYDKNNLRFACDYDCRRIRNVLVSNSFDIKLKDFNSIDSGFWNVHILYSHDVLIDNINVDASDPLSPSTDGIDIDSCYNVEVKNCNLTCNDDSICIKSGRDADGLRVGIPSHDIKIHDCNIYLGFGVTIGSELSGGIYNIDISNIRYEGTDCGFRIKSTKTRKGYIKNITVRNLEMIDVKYLFHFYLNWNPNYSNCRIPKSYKGEIPSYWNTLCEHVDSNIPDTMIENIEISNIKAYQSKGYMGISRCFNIEGFEKQPMSRIKFRDMDVCAKEFGIISYANVEFNNTNIRIEQKNNPLNDVYDNRWEIWEIINLMIQKKRK